MFERQVWDFWHYSWGWRETLSWKVGFRRAKAGCVYSCPWWADERVYGLAFMQGRSPRDPTPLNTIGTSETKERADTKRWLVGYRPQETAMWFLFQGLIIFAVMASNIHWHRTPNGYVPALLGIGLAYGLTLLLSACLGKLQTPLRVIRRKRR
jgi:hypothetical protein